ncbi:MAG: hypothetical protein ACC682_02690 [Gemmatimonadota bacterium]
MTDHIRTASVKAIVCAVLAIGLGGCGGDGSDDIGIGDIADFARAAREMSDAAEEMTGDERVDPVDFRELKDLLPDEVIGWQRIEHEGERAGAAGFIVSTASALYQADEGRVTTISIEISDTGGLGGFAGMGMAAWLSIEVDRETDGGYERTTEYKGRPAYQTFQARDGEIGSAQLNFVVERRFIVQLSGADVRMEDVMSAADELDLDRLADLAKG